MEQTFTSNTQAQKNYEAAADTILSIFNSYKFTTDAPFDGKELKDKIVKAIQKNVESDGRIPVLTKNKDGSYNITYSDPYPTNSGRVELKQNEDGTFSDVTG